MILKQALVEVPLVQIRVLITFLRETGLFNEDKTGIWESVLGNEWMCVIRLLFYFMYVETRLSACSPIHTPEQKGAVMHQNLVANRR